MTKKKEKEQELALFGGNAPSAQTAGALKQLGNAARSKGDKLFLKLAKSGEWLFGPEEIPVEETERWAINPDSFMVGVIGWRDGAVVGEHMFALTSGETVNYEELETIPAGGDGDGWKEQISMDLRHTEEDVQLQYGTTSIGGRNMMAGIATAIGAQMEEHPEAPVPVVELHVSSYKHKKYGKIYTPDVRIVDWVDYTGKKPAPVAKKRNLTG
jgi:hypothetical protein